MPKHTRLRPLNEPRHVRVITDAHGNPRTVTARGTTNRVAQVVDVWRIADEWWRPSGEIRRTYYDLELENGTRRTVYRDEVAGTWWEQRG